MYYLPIIVTAVIKFISFKSCFRGQIFYHVWHISHTCCLWSTSPRDLSYYSVIHKRSGVKSLLFLLWFHQTYTRVWNKIIYSIRQRCDQQQCGENTEHWKQKRITRNMTRSGWESRTQCAGQSPLEEIDQSNWLFIHYLHTKRLIWAHFGFNSSRCNRYWREET